MTERFADLPLDPALLQATLDLGFTEMTPIQEASVRPLLAGMDLVGRSRTGSGKTLAFSIPLLQRIDRDRRAVQAMVLCPTRELATQVVGELRALGRRSPGFRVVGLTGGVPGEVQARTLSEGAHVVVGTPGRTLDHLRRQTLDVRGVVSVVLDEADRMLELGFADEMDAILEALPRGRQTALFSATFPEKLNALAQGWLREPVWVEIDEPGTELVSMGLVVEEADKEAALMALLRAIQPASALVFRNLKRTVGETAAALKAAGFSAGELHGDLEQRDRDAVMAGFRNGSVRVLVATDLAARGLDVAGLDLVVNVDLASQVEDHVHRVGRTGRAGRPGLAWTFVTPKQQHRLEEYGAGTAEIELQEQIPEGEGPVLAAEWVTLWVGAGRKDKLRPGDLLGALTGDCKIAGKDVGKIEIGDRWTFVAVAAAVAHEAGAGLSREGVKGLRVRVDRLG